MSYTDVDIYRFAQTLIDDYEGEAMTLLQVKIREARSSGDEVLHDTWIAVLRAVEVLKLMGPASRELLQ